MPRKPKKQYDPWCNSDIEDVFYLPVSGDWLADCMNDAGQAIEAKGGSYIDGGPFRGLYYRLGVVPMIEHSNEAIVMTWLYSYNQYCRPTEKPEIPCIRWKVRESEPSVSVQIHAQCKEMRFSRQFYQLIEVAKTLSRKQRQNHVQSITSGVIETAMQDEVKPSGRTTLLCNAWAYAETLLGRQPDVTEWQRLFKAETGRDSDHADPRKSMKEGIAALRRKYKK